MINNNTFNKFRNDGEQHKVTLINKHFRMSTDLNKEIMGLVKKYEYRAGDLYARSHVNATDLFSNILSNGPNGLLLNNYEDGDGYHICPTLIHRIIETMNYGSAYTMTSKEQEELILLYSQCITTTQDDFLVEINTDINWKDGAFGDSGSCLWGGRSSARKQISKHGAAIKIYKADKTRFARAWIAPIDGENVVIFNGYSKGFDHGHNNTLAIAKMIMSLFEYKNISWITLRNTPPNSAKTNMFFNGGGGLVIGSGYDKKEFDFKWPEEVVIKCSNCGSIIEVDNPVMSLQHPYCDTCAKDTKVLDLCNYSLDLYPTHMMKSGPDGLLYFQDNLPKVAEFVLDYLGDYIFKKDSVTFGKHIVHKSLLDTHKVCKCGDIIRVEDEMCVVCTFLGDNEAVCRQFIEDIINQYQSDLKGVTVSWR